MVAGLPMIVKVADSQIAEASLQKSSLEVDPAVAPCSATWNADDGVGAAHVGMGLAETAVVVSKVQMRD